MSKSQAASLSTRAVALAAGLMVAMAPLAAPPAHADSNDDAFFAALDALGVKVDDKNFVKQVSRGVCGPLTKGAKSFTWTVSSLVMSGIPQQTATTIAGEAMKHYCGGAVKDALT